MFAPIIHVAPSCRRSLPGYLIGHLQELQEVRTLLRVHLRFPDVSVRVVSADKHRLLATHTDIQPRLDQGSLYKDNSGKACKN